MNFTGLGYIINNFELIRPMWLALIIPALIVFFRNRFFTRQKSNWEKVLSPPLAKILVKGLEISSSDKLNRFNLLVLVGWIICIFALAGPTWEKTTQPIYEKESAIVILFDLSPSMMAEDIKPNRLTRARFKLIDVLNEIKEGVVGLIVYGDDAYVVSPLTDDSNTIVSIVPTLSPDLLPGRGSNIEDALEQALDIIRNGGFTEADIVIFTDGIDKEAFGTINNILKSNLKTRLSVIGIGTAEGAPIPNLDKSFLKQNNNIVIARLSETELKDLAKNHGGIYQKLSSGERDIESLKTLFNKGYDNEKSETEREFDIWDDKGFWLIFLLIPIFISYFRKGIIVCFLIAPMLTKSNVGYAFEWIDLWETADQQGQKAIKEENYKRAEELFKNENWKASAAYKSENFEDAKNLFGKNPTSTGLYNQGNALAKMGNIDQAIQSYNRALTLDPKMEDAIFNKELLENLKEQQENETENSNQKETENDKQNPENENADNSGSEDQENSGKSNTSEHEGDKNQTEQKKEKNENNGEKNIDSDQVNGSSNDENNQEAEINDKDNANNEGLEDEPKTSQNVDIEPTDLDSKENQEIEKILRKIPDDPGGLLRNKFRYQKIQRYREKSAPNKKERI